MADLPKIDEQPINLEQESVNRLGKAIFENATFHLEDAVKTVIPSIPKMIDELTAQIEDGSIKDVGKAFSKLEKIVEDLRIDLGRYNKELAEAVAQRAEMERKSQDKVDKLREQGVIARVDKDSKQVEILTKEKICKEIFIVFPDIENIWTRAQIHFLLKSQKYTFFWLMDRIVDMRVRGSARAP